LKKYTTVVRSTTGLSLLEIMIAVVILAVAFIPVFNIFSRGQSDTLESEALGIVTRLGQTGSDEINAMSYRELEKELIIKEGMPDFTKTYEYTPASPLGKVCVNLFEKAKEVNDNPKKRPPTMLNLETTLALNPSDGVIKATIIFKWKQKKKGKTTDQKVKISTMSVKISGY